MLNEINKPKNSIIFNLGYARKSTESDERQIQSIESQLSWMKGEVGAEEYKKIKIFSESKSAKAPNNRKEFEELFKEIEKINKKHKGKCDFEVWIYAWGLDRLSRNPVDSGTIQYFMQIGKIHKIICYGKTYNPEDSGIFMGMINAMSNQFILDLQKNVKRGMRDKANAGGCIQIAPNGYINNKETKEADIDKKLKPIVKKIFELKDQGYSYNEIVKFCKSKGYKTKRGTDFSKTTVENMIKNPFYIGFQKNEGVLKKGKHKIFIDLDLWNRVNGNKRGYNKQEIDLFPLKGIIEDYTGKKLTASLKKKKIKSTGEIKEYIYYHSHSTDSIKVSISQSDIIKYFDKIIHLYEINETIKPLVSEVLRKTFSELFKELQEERQSLNSYITQANNKLNRLFDLVCNGTITEEKYTEENNKLVIDLEKYKSKLDELSEKDLLLNEQSLFFVELLENLSTKRKTWSVDKKVRFIKILVVELKIDTKKELYIQEIKLFEYIKILLGFQWYPQ